MESRWRVKPGIKRKEKRRRHSHVTPLPTCKVGIARENGRALGMRIVTPLLSTGAGMTSVRSRGIPADELVWLLPAEELPAVVPTGEDGGRACRDPAACRAADTSS